MNLNTKKFLIFLVITILDLFLLDPLPAIDELLLSIITIYYGVKI